MISRRILQWLAPLLAAIGCSLAFLLACYALPFADLQDVGSEPVAIQGLYSVEANEHFSYAYSDGDTSFHLPQVGTGSFLLNMRLAGPMEDLPVQSRLAASGRQVDLGRVDQLRTYHVLIPADEQGNLGVGVHSTTVQPATDRRQLGLLIDWVRISSVGAHLPPYPVTLSVPVILTLCWLAAAISRTSFFPKLLLFLLATVALCISYALTRGKMAIHPLWLTGASLLPPVLVLSRLSTSNRSPLFVVTTAFIAWRVALSVVVTAGLWYSVPLYHIAEDISAGGSIAERSGLLWRALVRAWVQYDSGHYQNIALNGYTFAGQRWPNIAFFPLYPLLTRLLLPLTGNNITIAQLMVSHIALYAALLLLYDLLARDFDRGIAYWSIIMLLAFPTSVFLVAAYTESLALALAAGAVWAIRRGRWWLAGIAGGFLALTRLPGVLIAPLILFAHFQQQGWRWRAVRAKPVVAALLPLAGLGIFMLYQWWRFGTPFAFLSAQRAWDQHLSPPWTMPIKWVEWFRTSPDRPMMIFQAIIWISFIGLTIIALRRLPPIYGLTVLLLLLPAYLSNRSQSLPRYVLIGFPAFVAMAIIAKPIAMRRVILAIMLPLLAVAAFLFTNGFWVA